ncbi:MAG: glycoside hydrolase family 25 protein [Candidatus Moraniibacteriota bacterium]
MRGIDVARYQGTIDWAKVKKAGYGFAFQKCTEGTGYKDPVYQKNKDGARNAGLVFGSYHFGRGLDATKEADWFVKNVGDIRQGEILVLDFEIWTLKDPASWCLAFIKRVEELVGFKPMLYTYHAQLNAYNWSKVSGYNVGLWAARYGLQEQNPNPKYMPSTGTFPFFAIWQYCSRGSVPGIVGNVDLNTTDMDQEMLKKYGKATDPIICNHQCPVHCEK